MKSLKLITGILMIFLIFSISSNAQKKKKKKEKEVYQFTTIHDINTTGIRDQYRTGTCWSFATNSFLETELIRQGFEPIDLSEMWIIRHTYPRKALNYIQLHGKANFSSGGQAHDVLQTIDEFGIVPESVYPGLWDDLKRHNHSELDDALHGYLQGILKNINDKLSSRWIIGFNGILDAYLGEQFNDFEYQGKTYTPLAFAKDYLTINPDDYVELTSYTHHPFYTSFRLEVPDNWSYDDYYNLPLDDFMLVINHAIEQGYSVCWDGDMSEPGFSHKKNVAIVPEQKYSEMTREEKKELFNKYIDERDITQDMRQLTFQNFATTDDHLMHITGIAKDQNDSLYYLTKNSWGAESNDLGGYLYMSEAFVKLKTIAIMVHKDAIPEDIKTRLKL